MTKEDREFIIELKTTVSHIHETVKEIKENQKLDTITITTIQGLQCAFREQVKGFEKELDEIKKKIEDEKEEICKYVRSEDKNNLIKHRNWIFAGVFAALPAGIITAKIFDKYIK